MSDFLTFSLYGLSDGAILALAALGFVLIYKATGVINFAQGELLLIGAFTVYTFFVVYQMPLVVATLLAVVVAVLLGVVVERLVLRPMVGESPISVIMVTIGLASLLKGLVTLVFGVQPKAQPKILPADALELGGARLPLDRVWAIVIAALVLAAFTAFFRYSRHGIALRAVADDQQASLTVGISVRRAFAMAWALAAVSALIAGVLLGDIEAVSPSLTSFGLLVFPVVILGGLDSVPGTIVGGLIIGLTKNYINGFWDGSYAEVGPYVLLLLILLVRPYGLFGETRIERV